MIWRSSALVAYGVKPVPSEAGASVVRRIEADGGHRDWVAFEVYRSGAGRRVEVPLEDVERATTTEAVANLALDAWATGVAVDRPWLSAPDEARQVAAVLFRFPGPPSREARAEWASEFAAEMLRRTSGYAWALSARGEAAAEVELIDKVRDVVAQFASVATKSGATS